MPKLIILITPQLEAGYEIAETWQENGAPGVTLIDGYGLFRLQEATRKSEVLPGILSMLEILRSRQNNNIILLSVVDTPAAVDRLVDIADQRLGGLPEPDNGIIFVLDVEKVIGLRQ